VVSLGGFKISNKLNCPKVSYTIQRLESFRHRTAITWSFNNATDFKPPSITRRRFDYASIDHVTCYMLPFHRCHFTTQRNHCFFLLITGSETLKQSQQSRSRWPIYPFCRDSKAYMCPRIHTSVIYDIDMTQKLIVFCYIEARWNKHLCQLIFFF